MVETSCRHEGGGTGGAGGKGSRSISRNTHTRHAACLLNICIWSARMVAPPTRPFMRAAWNTQRED